MCLVHPCNAFCMLRDLDPLQGYNGTNGLNGINGATGACPHHILDSFMCSPHNFAFLYMACTTCGGVFTCTAMHCLDASPAFKSGACTCRRDRRHGSEWCIRGHRWETFVIIPFGP